MEEVETADEAGVLDLRTVVEAAEIRNESGVEIPPEDIYNAILGGPEATVLTEWANEVFAQANTGGRRLGGIFKRDRYTTPSGIYQQFAVAADAVENDDVVSGVVETTENLAFSKVKFDLDDDDQEDVWNQIAKTIDLDSRLREMWREQFTYSQVVVAIWWGTKNFKVRGKTETGTKKKKRFDGLTVPLGMTVLDPMKVAPVGMFWFGQEKLLYMPDPAESINIQRVLAGEVKDPIIDQIIVEKYVPNATEQAQLADMGLTQVATSDYFLLNPDCVWRHTDTRSGYKKFANVRLKSVFELLDIKNNLRQRDRTHLIAATNFIILITKGSDARPATAKEVNALKGYARTLARMPLLVGDHRLEVKIITPGVETTLRPESYNTVDSRITARLYRILMTGNYSAGAKGDDSIKLARVIGKGLESSRHQLKRALERNLFERIMLKNEQLTEDPMLRFVPSKIAMEFDQAYASFLIELRSMGEVSRETILSEFDFDQDDEARWRKMEKEEFDDVFETINPNNQGVGDGGDQTDGPVVDKKAEGRRGGGLNNGGGAAPGTGQGKPAVRPRKVSN